MRSAGILFSCLLAIGIAVAVGLYRTAPQMPSGPIAMEHESAQSFSQIERGRQLVVTADCMACHTDPKGGKPFAGGRSIETPFGNVLAPNITPDQETGLGTWTHLDFANALQRGFSRDGHMLYPAMPYIYYTKMTSQDVDAIYAFLRTVQPVQNAVQPNRLPFPFNIRLAMRAWNALYFTPGPYHDDPKKSEQWNRGAYLVQGPEHCGACHTPKSALGGDNADEAFQGYTIQNWFAPNITNDDHRGLGSWSQQQVVDYLRTGHNLQAAASGPMAEEVNLSSSNQSEEDLQAIATYLKDLPGQMSAAVMVNNDNPVLKAGKTIYEDSCTACHRANGVGTPGLFPSLKGSPSVQSREATSLVRVILEGARSVSTDLAPTGAAMPSYGWKLDDDQIAAVLTYIRQSWGNRAETVKATDVSSLRQRLTGRQ